MLKTISAQTASLIPDGREKGFRKTSHLVFSKKGKLREIQSVIPIITIATTVPNPFRIMVEIMNARLPIKNTGNINW
ncbi:MAG TPA: hypothetical protein ENL09_04435 [Bacteroidetes bacterium]|nr:hypothetical protein [Bacteroidota bacterium]